jgi:hypothetical protein
MALQECRLNSICFFFFEQAELPPSALVCQGEHLGPPRRVGLELLFLLLLKGEHACVCADSLVPRAALGIAVLVVIPPEGSRLAIQSSSCYLQLS